MDLIYFFFAGALFVHIRVMLALYSLYWCLIYTAENAAGDSVTALSS